MDIAEADKSKASEAASHSSAVPSQCAVTEKAAAAAGDQMLLISRDSGAAVL